MPEQPLGAVVVTLERRAKRLRINTNNGHTEPEYAYTPAGESALALVAPLSEMVYIVEALRNA